MTDRSIHLIQIFSTISSKKTSSDDAMDFMGFDILLVQFVEEKKGRSHFLKIPQSSRNQRLEFSPLQKTEQVVRS